MPTATTSPFLLLSKFPTTSSASLVISVLPLPLLQIAPHLVSELPLIREKSHWFGMLMIFVVEANGEIFMLMIVKFLFQSRTFC